jgi:serine protease Do
MKRSGKLGTGLAVLASCVLAVFFWGHDVFSASKNERSAPPKVAVEETPISRQTKLSTSYAPVVKKAAPSVVNIYSTKMVKERPSMMPFFDDPFFRRFFGDESSEEQRRPSVRPQYSLGSGVIVSSDGFILSNSHVVEGADEVKVAFAQGDKEYAAKVIGTDPPTDISVLKIEAKDLSAVTFGDSDNLEVGDVVLAIGNPFGVGQTVTMGIVGAVGRGELGITDYEDFIQTDASINPGNSGGALVDAEGRLVGINTAILSRTGGNQGIGFAIPANMARAMMDRIVAEGKVVRGYLGVLIQPITPGLAKEFNLRDQADALIGEVTPKSPAEEAGLKPGDVITEFNGKKVNDSRHLRLMVARTAPKTKVTMKALRDGKERTLSATLDELPVEVAKAGMRSAPEDSSMSDVLDGVTVTDLQATLRRQFDIPPNLRGALVTEVDTGSPAFLAGLRAGDVIVEINRQPVRDAEQAVELSKKVKEKSVLLRVWSRGGTRYVVVDGSRSTGRR